MRRESGLSRGLGLVGAVAPAVALCVALVIVAGGSAEAVGDFSCAYADRGLLGSLNVIKGTRWNDTLIGANGPDAIYGPGGNDIIDGAGGPPSSGGAGNNAFQFSTAVSGSAANSQGSESALGNANNDSSVDVTVSGTMLYDQRCSTPIP